MIGSKGTQRFEDSTRGRIVALLKAGQSTVDAMAESLQLTDNAVRQHLAVLERDGIVRQTGVRRSPGAGKPASLYELHPGAEAQLSRAYAPLLTSLVEVLGAEMPASQVRRLLRLAGKRVANALGGAAPGDWKARARAAAVVLESLGAAVAVCC